MQPECSLLCLQDPVSCPCPAPDEYTRLSRHCLRNASFHIIVPSLPCRLPNQNLYTFRYPHTFATCHTHMILFDVVIVIVIWWRVQTKFLSVQFPHTSFASFFLGYNIPLSTLFWKTLNLCSSLKVKDKATYKVRPGLWYIFRILRF
jgi:hypothetical protein